MTTESVKIFYRPFCNGVKVLEKQIARQKKKRWPNAGASLRE